MALVATVELNGHPHWASVGKGKDPRLVFLHGGLSSSGSLLRSMGPLLEKEFTISAFDRRGHGRTADLERPFHYAEMAEETVAFLEYLGGRSHLLGHSDGGIVALLTVMARPDLVDRVVVVGTNYHVDGLATDEALVFEGPEFAEWALDFAELSPDGFEHARAVADKSLVLVGAEPRLTLDDLERVTRPVLVMMGDDDVIDLHHAVTMYHALPDAQLCVMPGTSHALLKERSKDAARLIRHFLTEPLPPVTQQPVRRRSDA